MVHKTPDFERLDELLQRLFDHTLTGREGAELQAILKHDRAARRRYLTWVEIHGTLRWEHRDANPVVALPLTRTSAFARSNWLRAAAAIAIAGLATFWAVRHTTSRDWAARVTRVSEQTVSTFSTGSIVPKGQPVSVGPGGVELAFASGSTAVIEGPAVYTIDSDRAVSLVGGRIAVRAVGDDFIVNTPQATVYDRGTEFGVSLEAGRPMGVEVFKGRVDVAPVTAAGAAAPWRTQSLTAGQAVRIANNRATFESNGANAQHFVRGIDPSRQTLDVVDLLCGGDGTTGLRGTAISPVTGSTATPADGGGSLTGDGQFHPVSGVPVIDGAFVPGQRPGGTVVDSSGHRFSFPATSGKTFGHIWAGGNNPGTDDATGKPISGTLGSVDYTTGDHAPLFMHSNKALTIDLDAVRRMHPGRTIRQLHFTFGNTYAGNQFRGSTPPMADLFVLIDGRSRFERRAFFHGDGPRDADVPIAVGDRFLTLAVTDGSDDIFNDWVLIADPVLRLDPVARP